MKNAKELIKAIQKTVREKIDDKCKNCPHYFTGAECDTCEPKLIKGSVHQVLRIEFEIPNDRDLPKQLFHFINMYGKLEAIINPSRGMEKTLNKLIYRRPKLKIPENKECNSCERIVKPSLLMKEEGCWYCVN